MATALTTSVATSALSSDKYRGAVVEVRLFPPCALVNADVRPALQDLQLPPAFSLPQDESISRAVELAYERDFDYIPYVFDLAPRGP